MDSGWAQIGSIHLRWVPDQDMVEISRTDNSSPPMKMNGREAHNLYQLIALAFAPQ